MAWWGKLAGGAFGYMLGGPLGALLGAAFGHQFDAKQDTDAHEHLDVGVHEHLDVGAQERVQAAFFTATFAVMGCIAKADGRVSRDEIALAERVMAQMQLDRAQRQLAQSLFNQGKAIGFDMDEVLLQLRRECHRRGDLIGMFMEVQIEAAFADGDIAPQERIILRRIADDLGITRDQLAQLINLIIGAHRSHNAHDAARDGGRESLANAYRILGVTANTPLPEVRNAYRRLLRRHHPDKLVAKGLPEEMIQLANEKTHEIRSAWERVKAARK